jgi:hypothetical protein
MPPELCARTEAYRQWIFRRNAAVRAAESSLFREFTDLLHTGFIQPRSSATLPAWPASSQLPASITQPCLESRLPNMASRGI